MSTRLWLRPLILLLWGLAALISVVFDAPDVIRTPVAASFLLLGPGLAVMAWFTIGDRLEGACMAIGTSLCLDTIVAVSMSYGRIWSPQAGLVVLVALMACGSLCELFKLRHQTGVPQIPVPS